MMLSEVKRIKIKSNEIERQLEKCFSSLLVCGAEAGWRNALLSWESWILEGRRVHAGCTCCFNYSLTWWFRTLRWTCSLRLASASLSLSLSLSARFSFVFKLKRNVGPFFVVQLVELSVKREKRKKMDSPVGHRPCWYTDTGEEEEREREREHDRSGRTMAEHNAGARHLTTRFIHWRFLSIPPSPGCPLRPFLFFFVLPVRVWITGPRAGYTLRRAWTNRSGLGGPSKSLSSILLFLSSSSLRLFIFCFIFSLELSLVAPPLLASLKWLRPAELGSSKKRRRIARSVTEKGHRLEHLIDI